MWLARGKILLLHSLSLDNHYLSIISHRKCGAYTLNKTTSSLKSKEGKKSKKKRSGLPQYPSIKIVRAHSIDWNRKFRKNFRLELISNCLNPFLFEIQRRESLKYLFDWKSMIHILDYSIGVQWDSKCRFFLIVQTRCRTIYKTIDTVWFLNSIISTSRAHFFPTLRVKGKM